MTALADWEPYERFRESSWEWRDDALCATLSRDEVNRMFFPERGMSVQAAKDICAECSVRAQCLEYALRSPMLAGIWGGTSQRQRHEMMGNRPHHKESRDEIRIRVRKEMGKDA